MGRRREGGRKVEGKVGVTLKGVGKRISQRGETDRERDTEL